MNEATTPLTRAGGQRALGVRSHLSPGRPSKRAGGQVSPFIDFLVLLGHDSANSAFDAYFALKDALEQVLGRPVDLVSDGAVHNPYIKAAIDHDRQLVYAA